MTPSHSSMTCPHCGAAMRLLGKSGTRPARRHWECVNRDLFNPQACNGYAMTRADRPLSAADVARALEAHPQNKQDTTELGRLAERLLSDHDAYHYLTDAEHGELLRAGRILEQLAATISDPAAGQPTAPQPPAGRSRTPAPGKSGHKARETALNGYWEFNAGYEQSAGLERCRALDRYLKYRRNAGANIDKAVDQLLGAIDQPDAERAWAALMFRVGHVWRHELTDDLSQADFEQYWQDWRASWRVRAAIDQALGQENGP